MIRKILIIGCGMRKPKDTKEEKYIGIDIKKFKQIDFIVDVGKDSFPFEDNSIDEIQAEHLFEHLGWNDMEDYFVHCIEECFRVLKPKGFLYFVVPRFPSDLSVIHPEHRRFFVPNSFGFFQVPADGIDPHGYLKGFWHININNGLTDELQIVGRMYPNKKNGYFEYKKVKRKDE